VVEMKEENLSKITGMLLAGGKMLGIHCATCMGPLFEYQGKVVCPVCGEKTRPEKTKSNAKPLKKVREALHTKLDSLSEQLAKETDQTKTQEILENIKSTREALKKLEESD